MTYPAHPPDSTTELDVPVTVVPILRNVSTGEWYADRVAVGGALIESMCFETVWANVTSWWVDRCARSGEAGVLVLTATASMVFDPEAEDDPVPDTDVL